MLDCARALRVEHIKGASDLDGIRAEWQQLWHEDPRATPFQSPAWLIPWWYSFGNDRLFVLAMRRDTGELAGIVPLYVFAENRINRLLPLGISVSDYLDGVFAADCAIEWAEAALQFVAEQSEWDRIELPQLREDSPLLRAAVPNDLRNRVAASDCCSAVQLPERVEDLGKVLPKRIRDNLSYYRRRAERRGPVEMQIATAENVGGRFEELVRLHQSRSESKGLAGGFSDPGVLAIHREAAPVLLACGLLRLVTLRCGGRAIAAAEAFADARPHGHFYLYLTGFDPEYAECSPGTLLMEEVLKQAIREGRETVDFLRGNEAYKRLWGATNIPTFYRQITRSA